MISISSKQVYGNMKYIFIYLLSSFLSNSDKQINRSAPEYQNRQSVVEQLQPRAFKRMGRIIKQINC